MVWDKTIPLGTEAVSNGDDRIRELKEDVETALRGDDVSGVEAVFPGSDTANPVYRYRGLKGTTAARPAAGQYGLYSDETRNVLQRDNGSSWVDIATLIPAGTVMVFFQAAAPVGWTKVVTQDDKVLRVVSGTGGGSGGTIATSTTLAHSHTVNAHTHAHTHKLPIFRENTGAGSGFGVPQPAVSPYGQAAYSGSVTVVGFAAGGTFNAVNVMLSDGTNGETASTPGTDSKLAGALAYVDVIVCSKD